MAYYIKTWILYCNKSILSYNYQEYFNTTVAYGRFFVVLFSLWFDYLLMSLFYFLSLRSLHTHLDWKYLSCTFNFLYYILCFFQKWEKNWLALANVCSRQAQDWEWPETRACWRSDHWGKYMECVFRLFSLEFSDYLRLFFRLMKSMLD